MELNTFQNPLAPGLLLLSKPEPGDPRFLNSVSLLCAHDDDGSFALILNHPLPLFIDSEKLAVSEQRESPKSFPLFRGGPVGHDQCFFLMICKTPPLGSHQVCDDLFMGTHPETLRDFEKNEGLQDNNVRFFPWLRWVEFFPTRL